LKYISLSYCSAAGYKVWSGEPESSDWWRAKECLGCCQQPTGFCGW